MNASPFRIFGFVFLGVFALLVFKTPLQGALGFLGFKFGENKGLADPSYSSYFPTSTEIPTTVVSASSWFYDSSTLTTAAPISTFSNSEGSSTYVANSTTSTEHTTTNSVTKPRVVQAQLQQRDRPRLPCQVLQTISPHQL